MALDPILFGFGVDAGPFAQQLGGAERATNAFDHAWEALGSRFVLTGGDIVGALRALSGSITSLVVEGGRVGDVMQNTSLDMDSASKAVEGLADKFTLAVTSNRLMQAGMDVTQEQFEAIAKGAQIMAMKTGGDADTAMMRLTQTLVMGSERGLKPLGITLREVPKGLDDATAAAFRKKDAVEQLTAKMRDAKVPIDDAGDAIQQYNVALKDATHELGMAISENQLLIGAIQATAFVVRDSGRVLREYGEIWSWLTDEASLYGQTVGRVFDFVGQEHVDWLQKYNNAATEEMKAIERRWEATQKRLEARPMFGPEGSQADIFDAAEAEKRHQERLKAATAHAAELEKVFDRVRTAGFAAEEADLDALVDQLHTATLRYAEAAEEAARIPLTGAFVGYAAGPAKEGAGTIASTGAFQQYQGEIDAHNAAALAAEDHRRAISELASELGAMPTSMNEAVAAIINWKGATDASFDSARMFAEYMVGAFGQAVGAGAAAALNQYLGASVRFVRADAESRKAAEATRLSRSEAFQAAARDAIKAVAMEATVRAAMETALGLASLALGPIGGLTAGQHFAAAGAFAAIAGVAAAATQSIGAVTKTLPGRSEPIGPSTPPLGGSDRGQGEGRTIINNYNFTVTPGSNPDDYAAAVERALLHRAREQGRALTFEP